MYCDRWGITKDVYCCLLPYCIGLRGSHFQCGRCRGKAISEFRKPEGPPPAPPTLLGTETSVTSSMCNTVDFLSVCCGIQSGTLCRSGFLGSSAFIMVHCADLLPGFFSIYSETLRRYSYTPTIPGQDARVRFRSRPGFYLFSCRLEVSARGRGYRFGLLRRRGDTT